ncbi:hypothetical protein HETIRDRAFT_409803 [Heterobasidion irregulare TC 32-1]|uniref:Uncharacterized protein n=1 Tax=Heterobasidion irregulare (strain TC 32-1) TaxID=747525 RepID=W4K321_HETIT|nr:uncharacterized protein HETIRDRAFT_409803 [Heterobasidion irregulare TC 32-1]ETW80218.1 hypothetical protein HETIRDRAFT_409803 [Heterobasidion irregulare TC 32-1]
MNLPPPSSPPPAFSCSSPLPLPASSALGVRPRSADERGAASEARRGQHGRDGVRGIRARRRVAAVRAERREAAVEVEAEVERKLARGGVVVVDEAAAERRVWEVDAWHAERVASARQARAGAYGSGPRTSDE